MLDLQPAAARRGAGSVAPRWCVALACLAALAAGGGALDQVVVEKLDGTLETRDIATLGAVGWGELKAVSLRFEGADQQPERADANRVTLEFRNGDRIRGALRSASGDRLTLSHASGESLEVDVDRIESLLYDGRLDAEQRASLARPAQGDRLYRLREGGLDRIDGTLEEFLAEGPRFDSVLGKKTFAWSEVAALFIEALSPSEGAQSPSGGTPSTAGARTPIVADLADGGRIHARLVSLGSAGCRLEFGGQELLLPLSALQELTVDDGTVAFLSALEPLDPGSGDGSPFGDQLGMSWPHRVDASVTGAPLRVGGRTWRRGIGVHSPSRLTWRLDGQFDELRGAVGIDDQALGLAGGGAVNFRVLLDGKSAWESGTLHAGEPPRALPPVHLGAAKELTLEADMDAQSFIADRADWLRLLLVRTR
jgi:NPCBM/NEW2 domain-containing protein